MVRKFHVGGTVPIAPKSRMNAPQDSTINPRFYSRPSRHAAQETPQSQPVSEPAAEPAAEPDGTLVTHTETAIAISSRTETRYRDEKVKDVIALLTCTGPATNDIGPFLGSEDERRPVAEAIVDTIGPDVAVQLVISFLKKQEPTVTASEILEGCCGKLDNIKAAQAEMRAGGQTIREENGRFRTGLLNINHSESAAANDDYYRVNMMWHHKPHHTKVYNALYVKEHFTTE